MATQSTSASLFASLKATRRLPTPPGTALKVLELCRSDDADIQQIADVIMSDPALAGRLMKFANSPMAGLSREVISVREAVLLLGLRTVKLTALGFSIAAPEYPPRCRGFDLKRYWAESFITAVVSRHLAKEFFNTDREEAFTAGVLAKIGELAFAQGIPEEYNRVLAEVQLGSPLIQAEQAVLGTNHAEFGGQLLTDWDLPAVLVQAVTNQFDDPTSRHEGRPMSRLAQVVQVATRLAPVFLGRQDLPPDVRQQAIDAVEKCLKLDEKAWKAMSETILTEYIQVAEVFDVQLDSQASVLDLYAEAREEATRVGMVAQLERTRALEDNRDLLVRATTDALTGVANRAKLDERLDEAIKGTRRGHGDFALIMFDIDHFKKCNDTYGHQAGDLVLKRVATAVRNTLRDVDMLARYGGEEFVILAPQSDRKGACIVAARVRRVVEELRVEANGHLLGVTISLGLVITADYQSLPEVDTLIADADAQLYMSKQAGRNTWSYLGRTASRLPAAVLAS